MSKAKPQFASTSQGIAVYYTKEVPPSRLWLMLQQEEDGSPKLYESNTKDEFRVLLANGEYFSYVNQELADKLEFVEQDGRLYTLVNPIVVPDEAVLKKAKKVGPLNWDKAKEAYQAKQEQEAESKE